MGQILIVDDEKSIRITLKEFLRNEGHDVSVAENADEAMKLLKQGDFDVVVTDIILPRVTGVELLKVIRQISPNVQVIMITGEPTIETASEALRAGAADYLFKPISKQAIVKAVTNAMRIKLLNNEKQRLEEENRKHREELEFLVEERTKSLRESEKTALVLLNSPPDAAILMDINGKVLVMNDRMAARSNGKPEDFLGKSFHDFMPPSLADSRSKHFQEVLRSKQSFHFQDERDGKVLDNRFYPVFDNEGNVTKISVFSRDITEQIRLKEQIRQAQKMEAIGTLAGGIAHDFNNILFPILGYTDMCMDELPQGSRGRKHLEEVIKGALRAQGLIQQILSFSHQAKQERRPVIIRMILKEVLKLIRASLPSTIEIKQNIISDGAVVSDPGEIHQIFMNLIANAYHAMRDKGGILNISLSDIQINDSKDIPHIQLPTGKYIKLEIRDSGCGIDQAIMARIFEPYFTTKEKGKGTGLGLATVYGIVKSLDGEITLNSEVDKGTTFFVYFPKAAILSDAPDKFIPEPIPRGSERILLVDDETQVCQVVQQMLQGLGYNVKSYSASHDALDEFMANPYDYDLLLTDFTMPGMTGLELSQRIMAIRPELPVVMMSGYNELINEEQAKAAGIREYLTKPVHKRNMGNAIRRALDNIPLVEGGNCPK